MSELAAETGAAASFADGVHGLIQHIRGIGLQHVALVHATFELQRRYGDSHHLRAACLHPGAVYTNIADQGLRGNPRLERLRKALAPVEAWFLLTPEEGAQTSV